MEQSILLDREFLVVDFEFTVYDKPVGRPRAFFSEIIEFGASLALPPGFEIIKSNQGFVKPRFFPKHAQKSQEFAMIRPQDLADGMDFEEMLAQLAGLYKPNVTFVVAWGDADWKVLDTACARYKAPNPLRYGDYIDLAQEYRHYFGYDKTPSLKKALEEQALASEGFSHMALNDANNTVKLVARMISLGWTPKIKAGVKV